MKKTLLIAAAVALTSGSVLAQIPDNSICPDWTGTDLNGNSHNLYSILDSGYTVFIDVSATWCGPCWSYHNTHALENLYTNYGPSSTANQVRVFFIEGDAQTTLADLNGTGTNTQGNWITGTPYPIIDNATIANLLQISYFPTIYKVCPNRLITEIGQKTTAQLWASVASCQVAVSPSDGALLPGMGSIVACVGNNVPVTARLQNLGTTPMTSATIEARQGSTVLGTVNWTGNLATYAVENVAVTNYAPTASGSITLQITSPDDNASNNTSTAAVTASSVTAGSTDVTFQLQTDNYGSETRWKLFDPSGSVFAQGGPYTNSTSSPLRTFDWSLENNSCYRLELYDAYGDGFCCSYGQGFYNVISNGQTIITGGTFTSTDVKPFSINAGVGISTNELEQSLNVYPNPSTGLVNLEYSLDQGATVKVLISDVVGKVVMERTIRPASGFQRETLDLNDLSNGIYVLKVDAGNHQATRTITLSK
ncbi:MAG: T9SS type A sorting domain-containing protein [Flavobacteriales bacterium]